jgi:hypothetical protein
MAALAVHDKVKRNGASFNTDRHLNRTFHTGSIRNDPYWTSKKNSLELIDGTNKGLPPTRKSPELIF